MRTGKASTRRFDGDVAVVTGASSGIGRRVALDLASRGAIVVGVARRADLLDEVQTEMRRSSPSSTTRVCDLGDADAFKSLLAEIEATHSQLDVLINNAGMHRSTPVEEGLSPFFTQILQVNFLALVTGTFAVLPGMLARGRGIVVNVSSDSARAPEPGESAYASSKAAVSAFTESIAHEVASRGVHVHVLYPAWVPTAMGMSGIDRDTLPPKAVRRTEEQVSALLLERMGGRRMEINAALLPMLAPIGRSIAPLSYQRAMRQWSQRSG